MRSYKMGFYGFAVVQNCFMWQNGHVWLANKTIFFYLYKRYQAGWGSGGGGAKTHKILPVIFDIGNAKTHKILPVIFDIGNSSLCDLTMVKPHKCNRV